MSEELGLGRPSRLGWILSAVVIANAAVGWLTWVKVGASTRNSYEVFRSAQRFQLEQLDPLRFAWFMAPVLTLICLLLVVIGFQRWAAIVGLVQSLFVGLMGLAVLIIGVNTGLGPIVALLVGAIGVCVAISLIVSIK